MHWFTRPGWPGNLLALLAGTLTTLSLAPFDIWPLALLSVALLYLGLRETGPKQAAQRGWCYGFGLFASGVSWVYVSIHDFGAASPPLAGLLTFGFVAGLALFFALLGWLWVRLLRNRHSALGDALAFAALWLALGEYPPAEARLRDVLSLEPHDGAAAEALAEVLVASGGAEAEIAALRQRASRFGVEPRSS